MFGRPLATAAQRSPLLLRRLSSRPFPEGSDQLSLLLGDGAPQQQGSTTSQQLWGDHSATAEASNPPTAPPGSIPYRSTPVSRYKHHPLPAERHFNLHVVTSRNNTILTLTDAIGNPRAWVSAGRCGFKNVQRSGYEAGYQCAVNMFRTIEERKKTSPNPMKLSISFKGFGHGREAVYRALMASEGDAIRDTVHDIRDTTPIKIGGGTKAKKARRL